MNPPQLTNMCAFMLLFVVSSNLTKSADPMPGREWDHAFGMGDGVVCVAFVDMFSIGIM